MPELRKDPITGRWVIIATDRAKRPSDFIRQSVPPATAGICPFDYGNERKTPPEITNDPKVPANMIFVFQSDGTVKQFKSGELPTELVSSVLKAKN